jgi:Cation efflux family
MLTDATAIGLSLVAIPLAQRPAKGALNFGLKRTEILSAQFNGATLLVLALLIIYEGITRLITPPAVAGTAVLGSSPAHARSGFTLETRAHPDRARHPRQGRPCSRAFSPSAAGPDARHARRADRNCRHADRCRPGRLRALAASVAMTRRITSRARESTG